VPIKPGPFALKNLHARSVLDLPQMRPGLAKILLPVIRGLCNRYQRKCQNVVWDVSDTVCIVDNLWSDVYCQIMLH